MTCQPCQIRAQHPTTGHTNANCWHCKANELARGPEAHQAFSTGKVDRLWKATQRIFPSPLWGWARGEVRRYWGKRPTP
jgi:hypothetical protein